MVETGAKLNPLPEKPDASRTHKMSPMSQNVFRTTMWGLGIMLATEPAINAAQITGSTVAEINRPLAAGVGASTLFAVIYGAARALDYGALAIIQEGTPEGERKLGKIKNLAAIAAGGAAGYVMGIGASWVTFAVSRTLTQDSSPLTPEINNVIDLMIRGSWTLTGAIGGHLSRLYYPKARDFLTGEPRES